MKLDARGALARKLYEAKPEQLSDLTLTRLNMVSQQKLLEGRRGNLDF